jgi:hypothetical protein
MATRIHEVRSESSYLTLEEAAVEARRSVNAMYQLRAKKRGPRFRKIDGRLIVSRIDFDAWMSGDRVDEAAG